MLSVFVALTFLPNVNSGKKTQQHLRTDLNLSSACENFKSLLALSLTLIPLG